MKLTIAIAALTLSALTACSPLAPTVQIRTVSVQEGDVPCTEGDNCETPPPTATIPPADPALCGEGGSMCLDEGGVPTTTITPPPPNVCLPGEVEGGLPC